MTGRILLTLVVAVFATGFISAPALAAHCPKDVKRINDALAKMSNMKMPMMESAAKKGMALHKAGKHGESIKLLHQTMEALGLKH